MNWNKEKVELFVDKYLENMRHSSFMKTTPLHRILGPVEKYEEELD
jgi:hypothetical protein